MRVISGRSYARAATSGGRRWYRRRGTGGVHVPAADALWHRRFGAGKGRRSWPRAARNGRRNVSRARITKHGRTAAPADRRTVGVVFFFIFFPTLRIPLSLLPLLLIKRLIPCDCVRAGARSRTLTPVPSACVCAFVWREIACACVRVCAFAWTVPYTYFVYTSYTYEIY